MGFKLYRKMWTNGSNKFYSIPNVKIDFAKELLFMGDIKLSKAVKEKFKITNKDNLLNISDKKAIDIMKFLGYKWCDADMREII
jgi:hypothetical protein